MNPLPPPSPSASARVPQLRQPDRLATYEPPHYPEAVDDDGLDLRELWRIALKYRRTILLFAAIVIVTVVSATLIMRPMYRATTVLEVSPQSQGIVQFQNVQSTQQDSATFQRTQIEIIKSRVVAEAVVKRLNLGEHPAFNGELRQRDLAAGLREISAMLLHPLKDGISALFGGAGGQAADADGLGSNATPPEDAELRALVGRVQGGLTVNPIRASNLIEVSFESLDRQLAATVTNAVADAYLALSARKRFELSSGAESYLKSEIEDLQGKLETSEKDLYAFARRNQVVDLEDRNNIISTRLTELNINLSKVKGERIAAESLYRQLTQANVDSLPTVLQDGRMTDLRGQLSSLRAEYARLGQTYTSEYPRMQELRRQMDDIRATLEKELGNLVESLEVNYRQLADREERLTQAVEQQKQDLLELQDRAVQYNILKREWETNSQLYSGLLERMKEVGVAAGMERDTASVIDRALVPGGPFAPSLSRNLAIATVLGLMGGIGLALLLNLLDNSVRDPEEVERLVHLASLGLLPRVDSKTMAPAVRIELMAHLQREQGLSEAFRSIRTSLMFATPGGAPKVLMVTSAVPGEGKTTASTSLSIVLAQTGASVLLIDGDLRKPRLHKIFNVPRGPGLTEYLVQGDSDAFYSTPVENLTLMVAGTPPPNPAELLSSGATDRMLEEMSRRYDYVILDSSPVMGLADPIVLATKVNGVLLVSAAGAVSRGALREAVKRLRAVDAPLVGSVLNMVEPHSSEYSYYNRYYYNYGSSEETALHREAA
ncbi:MULTISPECIES: GumC family protein [unclassified Thiocapsa]|uniref:GumC family protein n=1 Tax=unclassified Thiocapsa TaxID=2641286 RepID=UPI0035AE0469